MFGMLGAFALYVKGLVSIVSRKFRHKASPEMAPAAAGAAACVGRCMASAGIGRYRQVSAGIRAGLAGLTLARRRHW